MPYDSLTGRTEADVLIPPESATEIIKLVAEESAALQLMRSVRMSSSRCIAPPIQAAQSGSRDWRPFLDDVSAPRQTRGADTSCAIGASSRSRSGLAGGR